MEVLTDTNHFILRLPSTSASETSDSNFISLRIGLTDLLLIMVFFENSYIHMMYFDCMHPPFHPSLPRFMLQPPNFTSPFLKITH